MRGGRSQHPQQTLDAKLVLRTTRVSTMPPFGFDTDLGVPRARERRSGMYRRCCFPVGAINQHVCCGRSHWIEVVLQDKTT